MPAGPMAPQVSSKGLGASTSVGKTTPRCRSTRMPEPQTRLLDFGPAPKAKQRSAPSWQGDSSAEWQFSGCAVLDLCGLDFVAGGGPRSRRASEGNAQGRDHQHAARLPPQERGSLQRKRSANRILQPLRRPRTRCVLTRDRVVDDPAYLILRNPPQAATPSKSCRTWAGWARRRAGRGDAKSLSTGPSARRRTCAARRGYSPGTCIRTFPHRATTGSSSLPTTAWYTLPGRRW